MKEINSQIAYELLMQANQKNPGGWVEHSLYVGQAARRLAKALNLHEDLLQSYGYLHDVGRYVGRCGLRHIYEGYIYLKDLGYEDAARICLTHSFFDNSVEGIIGNWDILEEQYQFVKNYIEKTSFTIYDKVIQLADCICLSTGFTTLERRLTDVFFRYGFDENTKKNFQQRLQNQASIEEMLGYSIYQLFPEVGESLKKHKIKDSISF